MADRDLGAWLVSSTDALQLWWVFPSLLDLLTLQCVSKSFQGVAQRFLVDVPRQLAALRKLTLPRSQSEPAGHNTWAAVTVVFTPPDPFASTVAAPIVRWRLDIIESEITSDSEDSDYDPFAAGAEWEHSYGGVIPSAEGVDSGGGGGGVPATAAAAFAPAAAVAPDGQVARQSDEHAATVLYEANGFEPAPRDTHRFIGPTIELVVTGSIRKGVFRRQVLLPPPRLRARIEVDIERRVPGLRILLPFAAGACNQGTRGPAWVSLGPPATDVFGTPD
jgi:hypothetical protein